MLKPLLLALCVLAIYGPCAATAPHTGESKGIFSEAFSKIHGLFVKVPKENTCTPVLINTCLLGEDVLSSDLSFPVFRAVQNTVALELQTEEDEIEEVICKPEEENISLNTSFPVFDEYLKPIKVYQNVCAFDDQFQTPNSLAMREGEMFLSIPPKVDSEKAKGLKRPEVGTAFMVACPFVIIGLIMNIRAGLAKRKPGEGTQAKKLRRSRRISREIYPSAVLPDN